MNPTPLNLTQLHALLAVAVRELTWTLPNVAREVREWRGLAARVPDAPLRNDALATLQSERLNAEGAALFAAVPRRRDHGLLRVLVAYQILLDYLDTVSERPADDPVANGRQLHLALVEAVDPGGPISDYYRYHPWHDDGGYLNALVHACRRECRALPSFELVRGELRRHAVRASVQALNHDPHPARRDRSLREWAAHEFPESGGCHWFELTAASCSSLGSHALFALATDAAATPQHVAAVDAVYLPWVCAASTLLDAFVDQLDDVDSGNHSYIAHYPDDETVARRLVEIVERSAVGARRLERGTRHALIASGMVSMYLSKEAARSPTLAATSRRVIRAAGSLPSVQIPIMRVLRFAHGVGDA